MLRFDIALAALKRRMAARPEKAASEEARPDARAPGVLIPFPLRRLAVELPPRKRRAPG